MSLRTTLTLASLVLSTSSAALAQDPAPPAGPPAPPLTCGPADVSGVPPADAATAVDLVCREVARQGRPGAYLVSLRPLGRVLVMSLYVTQPTGQRDERTIRLASIEEVPVVAPRLAEALATGKPLTDTQRVDNLVGEEVRTAPKKPSETRWSLGVIGVTLPGTGAYAMPGVVAGVGYETQQFGALIDFRAATRNGNGKGGDLFSLAIGGRYFFSTASVSPFVGGGFAWTGIEGRDSESYGSPASFHGSASGLWPWGEVGVQLFRLHQSRLTASVRVDVPFQSLQSTTETYAPAANGTYTYDRKSDSRYELPITIGVSYSF